LVAARLPAAPAGVDVHQGAVDQSFDVLWAEVARDYPCLALRDSATLDWRYRQHPTNDYTILVDRQGDRLRGYIVVTVLRRHGLPWGRIVDLLTGRDDEAGKQRLIAAASHELRRQGADRADCYVGDDTVTNALADCGFRRREKFVPLMVRGPNSDQPLYVMAGDGDGS
jgi:hypothetical protein